MRINKVLEDLSKNKPSLDKICGKRKPIRHHKPNIDELGTKMVRIFEGKDATKLPGISDYNWLQLLSEIGTDLSKWKTDLS